jgi:hypothetical protein
MMSLTKIIIVFIVSIISYILGYITYKNDEFSPFIFIFVTTGVITFIVSLVGFLII